VPISDDLFSDLLYPDRDPETDHVHRYLKSIHNIVTEKGWWRLHTLWGDNIIAFFEEGIKEGIYNIQTPGHQYVLLIYLGACGFNTLIVISACGYG
jgi:hypothetical protein